MLLYTQNVYVSKGARSYNAIRRRVYVKIDIADGNLLCVNEQGKTQA